MITYIIYMLTDKISSSQANTKIRSIVYYIVVMGKSVFVHRGFKVV